MKLFFAAHWRGLVVLLVPLLCLPLLVPTPKKHYVVAYCLIVMAMFWVTEAIPLPITAFIPVFVFPIANVMPGSVVSSVYVNDTIMVFIGSLMLAAAIQQSGLHNRLALCAIRIIGYSHYKLLLAVCFMTMFISLWISNTGATVMMVPIIFSLLRVFESQGLLTMYTIDNSGGMVASKLTVCYFCAATFSATIGGIGTLVATGTNLVFKGLLETHFPDAPDYLTFPKFSAFTIPLMIIMECFCYLGLIITFFGFLRPKSKAAKMAKLTPEGQKAAKTEVANRTKALGSITFWECMVIILFGGAISCFFTRSPQIFLGWADRLLIYFEEDNKRYIRDSVVATGAALLMLWFPHSMMLFRNCTAKTKEELPKGRVRSVLDWNRMDASLPWSFMFLLGTVACTIRFPPQPVHPLTSPNGGGFAVSTAAGKDYSDLNSVIGSMLSELSVLPKEVLLLVVIFITILLTSFASNVACATVLVPIGMTMATKIGANPLWNNIGIGLACSFCFMLPVGTPGNLVVQSAAKIATKQMICAGLLPTLTTVIILWVGLLFYGPVIWPDLKKKPSELEWIAGPTTMPMPVVTTTTTTPAP